MQWKIFPDTNDISLILKVKFFNMESPANNRANN